eukprot:scaffold22823_cov103-Isochrysis_galbana.AAC.1
MTTPDGAAPVAGWASMPTQIARVGDNPIGDGVKDESRGSRRRVGATSGRKRLGGSLLSSAHSAPVRLSDQEQCAPGFKAGHKDRVVTKQLAPLGLACLTIDKLPVTGERCR